MSKSSSRRETSVSGKRRIYKCSFCSATFDQAGRLKVHSRTHTGEKPYNCTFCSASFSQQGNLKTHILTHTGEKPFKCNFCFSTFNQKSHLKSHIQTHTGEKPYKCSICCASFSQGGALRSHSRTHTGERPYKCTFCAASFAQQGNLSKHVQIHTGEKLHKCSYCVASFSQLSKLKIHVKTHMHSRRRLKESGDCLNDLSEKCALEIPSGSCSPEIRSVASLEFSGLSRHAKSSGIRVPSQLRVKEELTEKIVSIAEVDLCDMAKTVKEEGAVEVKVEEHEFDHMNV